MKIKYPLRLACVTIIVLALSFSIVISMFNIINLEEYSEVTHLTIKNVPANRGNIYSHDGQLLAVTAVNYDLRFDEVYAQSISNRKEIEQLAKDLSDIFNDKNKDEYLRYFNDKLLSRYLLIKRSISLEDLEALKKSKFYNKPLRGGLVVEEYLNRKKPNNNSAARTIGDLYKENGVPKYGLEYSYNSELMGEDGQCLVLYEPGTGDRKINNADNIDPKPGKDLITSIDLKLQDILEDALLRQLEKFEADFGTSILMDVKTGQIKAITNLKKTKQGKYAEILNFAVSRQVEPGSTMKLASIMAYFEDFNGNVEDTIDCKNGKYKFKGAPIDTYDSKKLGVVSLKQAFAHSSNIGVGRLIQKYYQDNPGKFLNRIYSFGLGETSKIDLIGVPKPHILSINDKRWSKIALPWMSFGYGVNFTALDILTFYNAVANNGYLVDPYLGVSLREGSRLMPIKRENMQYSICSKSTLKKTRALLQEVVQNGTAKKLNDLPFLVSGKTGTTVKNYMNTTDAQNKEYQSSFVGFFPSEDPQYSCIVLIDNPNKEMGYYGSEVALPVFGEIAHKIYVKNGLRWKKNHHFIKSNYDHATYNSTDTIALFTNSVNAKNNLYPNVVGMHIREALQLLRLGGHEIVVKGDYGNVKKQYPKANTPVQKDLAITLFI